MTDSRNRVLSFLKSIPFGRNFRTLTAAVCLFVLFGALTSVVSAVPSRNGAGGDCRSQVFDLIRPEDMPSDGRIGGENLPQGRRGAKNGTTEEYIPLVMIVIGFDGQPYNTEYDWNKQIFADEVSLKQYYTDMSFGKFTFLPVEETSAYGVGGNNNAADRENDGVVHVTLDTQKLTGWAIRDYDREADCEMLNAFSDALKAAAEYIEFGAYDSNGDGLIQTSELAVGFVVTGRDVASNWSRPQDADMFYIWPHAYSFTECRRFWTGAQDGFPEVPTVGGVQVDAYIAIAESYENNMRYDSTGSNLEQEYIGTLAHELGHYLGLPDMYDTASGYGDWSRYKTDYLSLMDAGAYGEDLEGNFIPFSLDIWSRTMLGWVEPVTLNPGDDPVSVAPSLDKNAADPVALRVNMPREGEYYLIENRRFSGWDVGLQLIYDDAALSEGEDDGGGLLLWHIDEDIINEYMPGNTMNNHVHRPGVIPLFWEKRGGVYDTIGTISSYDAQPFFDADRWGSEVVFPVYSADTLIGDTPADRSYSDLVLCLDSGSAPVMQVHLKEEAAGKRNESFFREYVEELIEYIDEYLREDGDSEECQKLIEEAIEALNALQYDESLTLDENCEAADEIVADLITALLYRRLDEGDFYVVTLTPGEAGGVPVEGEEMTFRASEQDDLFEIDDPEEGQFYFDEYYGICFVYPECPYTAPDGYVFAGWKSDDAYYASDPGDEEDRFPCTAAAQWAREYTVTSGPLPSCAEWDDLPDTAMEGDVMFLKMTIDRDAWDAGYCLSSVLITDENGDVTEITRIYGSEDDPSSDVTVFFLFSMPASDVRITAVFIEPTFEVTWVIDGESETESWVWGTLPTHADPEKPGDGQKTYTFTGWEPEIVPVTGNQTYTAIFSESVSKYTVTWLNDDGTLIDTTEVEYGKIPTHADAVKAPDAQYTYTFTGWTPAIEAVTGDATYTAVFEAALNHYTVTWVIDGRRQTEDYAYGDMPRHAEPTKSGAPGLIYVFKGWMPTVQPVTGNAVYTAVFEAQPSPFFPAPLKLTGVNTPVPSGEPTLPPAVAAPEPAALPFTDVSLTDSFWDDVKFVYDRNIMNGISDTLFDPFGTLTRGMVVTILYRLEGTPEVEYKGTFTDVPDGIWYTDGVEWAAENGIVNGYGNGKFGPTDEVTREQLAAILYRYADFKGYEIETAGFLPDGNISPWAVDYVNWAAANGVLQVSGGTVRANEKALRWEVAAAIRGFCENVGK